MVAWNSVPGYLESYSGSSHHAVSNKKLLSVAGLLALVAQYSSPAEGGAWTLVVVGCYVAAGVLSVLVLQNFISLGKSFPAAEMLTGRQRQLLGLRAGQVKPPSAPAASRSVPESLISPPNRATRPFLQPSVATTPEVNQGTPTLYSPGSRGSRGNVTPDQFQRVLQDFDNHVNAAPGAANGQAQATDFAAFGQPGLHQAPAPSGTYRPSATARGAAAVPVRGDGRISQSGPLQRAGILEKLGIDEESLEFGVERLREWFATEVLKPIVNAAECAHADVVNAAEQIGVSGIRLTALSELGTELSSKTADDSLTLAQLRHRIEELLRNPAYQNALQLLMCKQAIINYQKLLLVLRGEFPSGLLPPAPDGYILKRMKDLANGTCMIDFKWDRGGDWSGKPWSSELPTDSALILYLFAAFLAAPQWRFIDEDPSRIEGSTGVLYLGKIPPRVIGEYYAIIPARPPAGSKGTGIIGLQLGSQQPHFTLLLNAENALTETGHGALFFIMALFLQHCRNSGGSIGGRSLEYLRLDGVMEPTRRLFSLRNIRKLRIW